jgi:hypothetical protein
MINVSYSVDDTDHIRWVNEDWDRFAIENAAPQIAGAAVIGTTLWSHISDVTLQYLLQKIFARARASRQPIVLRCRCDSPLIRREIEVYLDSRDGASVVVTTTVIAEQPRDIQYTFTGHHGLLVICSWCNAVRTGKQWVELEIAVRQLRLLEGQNTPQIVHSLCDRCERLLRNEGPD